MFNPNAIPIKGHPLSPFINFHDVPDLENSETISLAIKIPKSLDKKLDYEASCNGISKNEFIIDVLQQLHEYTLLDIDKMIEFIKTKHNEK